MDESINLQNEIEQLRRLPVSVLRERYLETVWVNRTGPETKSFCFAAWLGSQKKHLTRYQVLRYMSASN